MIFRRRNKPSQLILSALLAGGSFTAFAIYGWDIELSAVTKALILIILVFLSISIPAAVLLVFLKLSGKLCGKLSRKLSDRSQEKDA